MSARVVSAILFYPRGGSSHVARALARGLRAEGFSVTLVSGSLSQLGDDGDARSFYGDVRPVQFDPALATDAPLRYEGPAGTAPMHPSFEDRPGASDVVFAALDDADFERQVRAWARELERAGAPDADLLHLHHLTPLNEAAARVAPDVPVIGQLHGTELSMLEQIAAGPPPGWTHATRWVERMREWAHRCSRLIVAPGGEQRAVTALGVPRGRLVSLPNGVDIERFRRRPIDRGRFWRRVLSEAPRGWLPGRPPGSVRYDPADVAELARTVVLLYVGRFTAVKRLDRLIGAFATARPRMAAPAALVLLGGHPGEWEHEHPADLVVAGHVADVYLAGWYAHESLPEFFSASDAVLTASEREQFGLTLIEGMACGIPAVAARSLGPELIIDPGRTGWLADSEAQLAESLIEVVNDPAERTRRGAAAKEAVGERFSWPSVAGRLAAVMDDVLAGATAPPAGEA